MDKTAAIVLIVSGIVWVCAALVFASCVWFGNDSKIALNVSIWAFLVGYFVFVTTLSEL